MPLLLYPLGRTPLSLDRRLSGPQKCSGNFWRQEEPLVPARI